MFKYLIGFIIILSSTIILYKINTVFEPKTILQKRPVVNILSDCIVLLSKEDCPYCTELYTFIKDSKIKYTTITLTDDGTFKFDDVFTNLHIQERESIINETQKILTGGDTVIFPTIIKHTHVYKGLPKQEIITDLFLKE